MNKKIRVPYNYLPFEFKKTSKIFSEWRKLIISTDFTLGKFMENFEKEFANYIGMKYCIGTNNGTDALILSLKALAVGKGDEVITVANTFYATVGAIVECGAKPVFVDCDERYQINENLIKEKITSKTKAIIPVHWGGASPNMNKIIKIAKKFSLSVVEDACMGIGAKLYNKKPGTFGIVNAFSMHPLKSLNVMGDGGMVVTNNKKLYHWMKKYRNHGMIDRNNIEFWGVNYRLQPLQAIVASNQLKKLDQVIKKRNSNAKYLDKLLSNINKYIVIPSRPTHYKETFALYMILAKDRDKLIYFLNDKLIEAKIHYPIPLHLQKASKIYGYREGDYPVSERQAKLLLTLPIHQFINKKQIDYMYQNIKAFYKINNE